RVGGGSKTHVPSAAPSAAGDDHLLSLPGQVGDDFSGFRILHQGAGRNLHHQRIGIGAMLSLRPSVFSPFRLKVLLVTKIDQGSETFIHTENHISAVTSVSAGRSPQGDKLFASKGDRPVAAIPSTNIDLHIVDKHQTVTYPTTTIGFPGTFPSP